MATMAEKIAIVGVACRLPGGVRDLRELWSVLAEGREVVGDPPRDRFDVDSYWDPNPYRPGKSYTFAGGFLDDIAGFDAEFFGISPREAACVDPQQRLLLELGVEALDDAGIAPRGLAGSDTAVFVGVSSPDYGGQQFTNPTDIGPYTSSGSALSNTANRLSHYFDLRGPSLKVDTACASALNAFHLACQHLRSGEGRVVLAAGGLLAGKRPATLPLGVERPDLLELGGLVPVADRRLRGVPVGVAPFLERAVVERAVITQHPGQRVRLFSGGPEHELVGPSHESAPFVPGVPTGCRCSAAPSPR